MSKARFPNSRHGSRAKVTTADKREHELALRDEVTPPARPSMEAMATVGCSLTVAQSTEYSREKLEVTAWCTLPCLPEEESIQEAYQAAYNFVSAEVKARSDEATRDFLPHLLDEDDALVEVRNA